MDLEFHLSPEVFIYLALLGPIVLLILFVSIVLVRRFIKW